MPSTTQLLIFLLGMAIGTLQLVSARWIKEEESTHPAYKLEKVVWGAVFMGSATATILTGTLRDGFRIFTSCLIVLSTIVAFIFIRYRRNNPLYHVIRLRTQRGVVLSGDMEENNQVISKAAALIRHHRAGGGQALMSEWAMLEIEHAMGVPPVVEWVADKYKELEERRDQKARASSPRD